MKGKPIKIDWDELESAFNNRNDELIYYLDLVTGQVILEGEGEGESFDEDDDMMDEMAPVGPATDDATMLQIEPPAEDTLVSWMTDFVAAPDNLEPDVAEVFKAALEEEEPVPVLKELLNTHDEPRDRWFLYRAERMREAIDAWVDANGVKTTEPAPWKVEPES
jgi:hypothetical protein